MLRSKFIVVVCSSGIPLLCRFSDSMSDAKSHVDQVLVHFNDFICDTTEEISVEIFRLVEV